MHLHVYPYIHISIQFNFFVLSSGSRELPEAAQVLRHLGAAQEGAQGAQEEVPLQDAQGDQVLPEHAARLGRGRATGLP